MKITKHTLAELESVYAICVNEIHDKLYFMCAGEGKRECLLFSPPDWKPSIVWEKPGGTMTLVPVPGRNGDILAIEKFFPIFQSKEAGIVYAAPGGNPGEPWRVRRVLDLPYVHRVEIVSVGKTPYLVAATLCAEKSFQEDWSHPGSVYVGRIPDNPEGPWTLTPVLEGITKNHGMHKTVLNGKQVVLIGGREGLFSLEVPDGPNRPWNHVQLSDTETSDMYVADFDGDGIQEIASIEPFHGDRLVFYKYGQNSLEVMWEEPIHFGHAVWMGRIAGRNAALICSRGGEKETALLYPKKDGPGTLEKVIIDSGVGATQIAVVNLSDRDLVLAANNGVEELALYEILP